MAQRILPNDILTVRMWCQDAEQASVNTWYYRADTDVGLGGDDAVAAALLDTTLAPLIKPMLNNNVVYRGVTLQIHRLTQDYIAQVGNAHSGAGTGGAISLPRQTAGLTSWKTALAGRAFRGRTYWPFPSSSHDVGDGSPTAGYTTLATAMTAAVEGVAFLGDGTNYTNVHFVLRAKPTRGVPWSTTSIIQGQVSTFWATIRRRGSYGRANRSPI